MAKAKQLPSGNWRVRVFDGYDPEGKSIYQSFTAETPEEAEYFAAEYRFKRKREEKPSNMTVGQIISRYIECKDTILSPTTISNYKKINENHFKEICNLKASELNDYTIQLFINRKSKSYSPKTIRNIYGLLSSAIKMYDRKISLNITLPQKQKLTYNTPDKNTIAEIIRITKGTPIEIPVLLSVWLSLRASEICGLKWSEVHDEYIRITEAKVYADGKQISKSTKTTSSTRNIPLPSYIKERMYLLPRDNEYVISLTGQAIYKRFTRILQSHGMPHSRFHDLRHANASIMLMLNIPDKYAMERGGWATNNTLKNVYQQTFNEEQKAVAEKVDSFFETLIK